MTTSLEHDVDFFLVDGPGFTEVEAYALLAGIGLNTSTLPLPQPLTAAADVQTGAMIALVPSDDDLKRLAFKGGEPRDQLHLTLYYLGDAANLSEKSREQIMKIAESYASDGPIEAQGFSINVFNPAGDEPCLVLGVGNGGPQLEAIHSNVGSAVRGLGLTLPEQHTPWVPHVTLTYSDDLSLIEKLAKKTGPITFDKIRVAFAGEVTDVPLVAPVTAAFWKSSEHPRDGDGRFIDVDGIDLTSFDGRVASAPRTPEAVRNATPLEYGGIGRARSKAPDTRFAGAVDTYMSGAFEDINNGLRRSKGDPSKVTGSSESTTGVRGTTTVRDALTKLDQGMAESKLRDDIAVSRGIVDPVKVFGKLWGDDVTGLSWREFGFSSTSPDRNYARNYARDNDGVMMNILVPKGTGAIYVEENLGGEAGATHHELVLQRGLRYRVIRDRGLVNGVRTLDVEVS